MHPYYRKSVSKVAVAGIIVVVAIVAAVLGYYVANSKQSTTNDVVITYFVKGSGYVSGSGSYESFIYPFNVTIVNRGSNTVSGLSVVIQVLGNGNVLGSDTTQVGTLEAGSQYSISTTVIFSGDPSVLGSETQTYTALLEQNGVVINQMNLG